MDVGENQLTCLPDSIENLTSLIELNVGQNQLVSVPESIGNMASLYSLFEHKNQLTALPESIKKLTRLTWLWFGDNPMSATKELRLEEKRFKRQGLEVSTRMRYDDVSDEEADAWDSLLKFQG